MSFYETDQALSEYLAFHYAEARDYLPDFAGAQEAFGFPVRCVTETLNRESLPENPRALDLGCAVGRSSFELSRFCGEVLGIDRSEAFIRAAERLRCGETLDIRLKEEGDRGRKISISRPNGARPERIQFQIGDALDLPASVGQFDVVIAVNLIDRVPSPRKLLESMRYLLVPGGQLVLISPYTWMEAYTPKSEWLATEREKSFEAIQRILKEDFDAIGQKELPFLIREHARKFQWSCAQASLWRAKRVLL